MTGPEIERWIAKGGSLSRVEVLASGATITTTLKKDCVVVTYADHVAAVAAAEERLWGEFLAKSQREDVYDRGLAAGLKAARDAVAQAPVMTGGYATKQADLAAIDGVEKP